MKRFEDDIREYGIIVGGDSDKDGNWYYAEINPSGSSAGWGRWGWWRRLLPWVGNWWYEVHSIDQKPSEPVKGVKIYGSTHAYSKPGSGGSYTFRGCVVKAQYAIEEIAERNKR